VEWWGFQANDPRAKTFLKKREDAGERELAQIQTGK